MKVTYSRTVIQIIEDAIDVEIPGALFLLVVRYTNKDGSQFIRRIVTDDYRGNVSNSVYKSVEVLQAFKYLSSDEIPTYDIYGDKEIRELSE